MPKDYKNIVRKKPEPFTKRFSNTLSFITGLAVGLFVAVIVYFHEHSATIKVNNSLIKNELKTTQLEQETKENTVQKHKPKFDFYKILPNKEVNISEWESIEDNENDEIITSDESAIFVLQVGSFKEFNAADEVKAKLALMGVTADIQRVVINGQDVRHRVRVGPYKNLEELQKAKDRLLTNDLNFMTLKLKVEDI